MTRPFYPLHTWFFNSADRYPDRPALYVDGNHVSYKQLRSDALKVAEAIAENDLDPDHSYGGILSYRSPSAYAGILGTLAAGKTYVPMNPKFPKERNLKVCRSAGLRTLVVDQRCYESAQQVLAELEEHVLVVLPDEDKAPEWTKEFAQHRFVATASADTPSFQPRNRLAEDLAYIIFTSGTTGTPKGVMISNASISSYLNTLLERYEPKPEDRFSQFSDLTFDWSIPELWLCWAAGSCLCVVPEKAVMGPANFIKEAEISIWYSVPSAITFMHKFRMLKANSLPSIRQSFFCGEALPEASSKAWHKAASNSELINMYGPTEATVSMTEYIWREDDPAGQSRNGIVGIGYPFPGQKLKLVDENLHEVKPGEEGEICIGGDQLAAGYWQNESLTHEKFVALPEDSDGPNRWYRTGDLAVNENGYLHYVGRVDHQIKIRGYRVELGEIEHTIANISGCSMVAVIGWPISKSGADGLIGFVDKTNVPVTEVIQHCADILPPYMVPREIMIVDKFPLNVNGKIDRRELQKIRENKGRE